MSRSRLAPAFLLTIGVVAAVAAIAAVDIEQGDMREIACYAAVSSDLRPLIAADTMPDTRCSRNPQLRRK